MPQNQKEANGALRSIPSVDELLLSNVGRMLEQLYGRDAAVVMIRTATDLARGMIAKNNATTRDEATSLIETNLLVQNEIRSRRSLLNVINATGVVIHTNLGRSPLSAAAVDAIVKASRYCNVELDLQTGERGRRGASAEGLLAEITGAEDALIVNNCAAAALLVLTALAQGGEVIVSRGELVEIGGDFRIPDVLEQSGCRLREVGTTNRTKLADYERAISAETKLLLRVHPSNYRITGFTETPELAGLADLAHRNGLIFFEDAGSGALIDLAQFGLGDEPVISASISKGVDIVAFSGDKLVGGVQAGLIVGKAELIARISRHPLYRAVRVDKVMYAGIEAALRTFAQGKMFEAVPTLRMISMTADAIGTRALLLAEQIEKSGIEGLAVEIIPGHSAIGGGAGPGVTLETNLIALDHAVMSCDELAAKLRSCKPPVIGRVTDERFLIDLRTVFEDEEVQLLDALRGLSSR